MNISQYMLKKENTKKGIKKAYYPWIEWLMCFPGLHCVCRLIVGSWERKARSECFLKSSPAALTNTVFWYVCLSPHHQAQGESESNSNVFAHFLHWLWNKICRIQSNRFKHAKYAKQSWIWLNWPKNRLNKYTSGEEHVKSLWMWVCNRMLMACLLHTAQYVLHTSSTYCYIIVTNHDCHIASSYWLFCSALWDTNPAQCTN